MKRIVVLTIIFMSACVLVAQDKPKETPAKPKEEATFTVDERAAFFKAQAQFTNAQVNLNAATNNFKEKQGVFQALIDVATKKCGDGFAFTLIKDGKPDNDGDPTCVVKPDPSKTPESVKK